MRIGAHVFGYSNAREWAQLHKKLGYGAAYWPLALDAPEQQVEEYAAEARHHDLLISEIGAWNNMLAADPDEAERNVQANIDALRLADRVGARCCINITGSLSDTWDGPHPKNMSEEVFAKAVENIRRIIDTAAPQRAFYTVEMMPWMVPNSIEGMQALLNAVGRRQFAVHADMCNMVNSFEKVYENAALTRRFFRTFGRQIKAVHAKDICLGKKLTLQITEVMPGQGVMDLDTVLTECEALDADMPVMVEHLNDEQEYTAAARWFLERAAKLGIECKAGEW